MQNPDGPLPLIKHTGSGLRAVKRTDQDWGVLPQVHDQLLPLCRAACVASETYTLTHVHVHTFMSTVYPQMGPQSHRARGWAAVGSCSSSQGSE